VPITCGEIGRFGLGRTRKAGAVLWTDRAAAFVHEPVPRYMKTYRLTTSNWRWCPWCSAKWGSEHPRATFRSPKTVERAEPADDRLPVPAAIATGQSVETPRSAK
jgi:hypothetical protein